MKRKDIEALIHIADPDQPVKGFTKKELHFLLSHSIHHLKYWMDHPERLQQRRSGNNEPTL